MTQLVKKSPLFVTVLGSGSAATANVYEVSEPRAESWSERFLQTDNVYSSGRKPCFFDVSQSEMKSSF